ncbi:MAG: ArsR/SmtB family transcription factor [Halobacteriaceae archaeon]
MTDLPPRAYFESHADLCKMFANANRLTILDLLRDEERTVTELTEQADIPQPTISQHLSWLREQGVVSRRKEGVQSYYTITDDRIFDALDIAREIIEEQLVEND